MGGLSRRTALRGAGVLGAVAAAGALGVELEVLPGRSQLYHRLGLDGADGEVPDIEPGLTVTGSFASDARGQRCGWAIAFPPGHHGALPVAVALHGRGGDHTTAFGDEQLGLDRFLAYAVARGVPPFALASVDGGESYWHDRSDGDRAAAMVVEELLPILAARGADPARLGLIGWSMGGLGALHLARLLGPERVAGVAAVSAALWRDLDEAQPGAFASAADFDEVDPFGRQETLDGIAVRIDCGEGDPFYSANREYVDGFDTPPEGGFERGDHDFGYWRRMVPVQLEFLGSVLGERG